MNDEDLSAAKNWKKNLNFQRIVKQILLDR